jgi:hypothetical protein
MLSDQLGRQRRGTLPDAGLAAPVRALTPVAPTDQMSPYQTLRT